MIEHLSRDSSAGGDPSGRFFCARSRARRHAIVLSSPRMSLRLAAVGAMFEQLGPSLPIELVVVAEPGELRSQHANRFAVLYVLAFKLNGFSDGQGRRRSVNRIVGIRGF